MWVGGMFLRQQHFQQQDRFYHKSLTDRLRAVSPYYWGLFGLEFDRTALARGVFGLTEARGIFPDGTVFHFPGADNIPVAIDLTGDAAGKLVFVVIPEHSGDERLGEHAASPMPGSTRYAVETMEVRDVLDETALPAELHVGALRLSFEVGDRPRDGVLALPIAKVAEVRSDRTVVLDNEYIPTVSRFAAAPALSRHIQEITQMLNARAEALSGEYSQIGGTGTGALTEFMQLTLVNSHYPRFAALNASGMQHPEALFRELVGLAGGLASFTAEDRWRPPLFPAYDHDNLTATFAPVIEEIRRSLGYMGERKAEPIPLRVSTRGVHFTERFQENIDPRKSRFFIIVRSSTDQGIVKSEFPARVTIDAMENMRDTLYNRDRGVPVEALDLPPTELPRGGRPVFFEISSNHQRWNAVIEQRSIAIHVPDGFQDFDLQLWAIRD